MARSLYIVLVVLLLVVAACGSEGAEVDPNLGTEGASCLRTPDCASPLQCMANVCVSPGGGGGVDSGPSGLVDVVSPVSDISFPSGPDVSVPPDVADVPAPPLDVVQPFDVGPDWRPLGPDVQLVTPDAYGGCGELGVESDWDGGFDGSILFWNVEAPPPFEGQVPESGTLIVSGDLSFEIRCLEQKLVVIGTLSGWAEAVGEAGSHPFEVDVRGEYNPLTERLEATLDGSVRLYAIFEIYFEGDFTGELSSGGDRFEGRYSGHATGNSMDVEGEASGGGDWWTSPASGG